MYDTHPGTACDEEESDANTSPAKRVAADAVKTVENGEVMLMERECKDYCLADAACRVATLSGTTCILYSVCAQGSRKEETGAKTFSTRMINTAGGPALFLHYCFPDIRRV